MSYKSITSKGVAIYSVNLLKDKFMELVTQTGLSTSEAARLSGYASPVSLYVASKHSESEIHGLTTMLQVLRSVGYDAKIQVKIKRRDLYTHSRDSINPALRVNTAVIKKRRRQILERKLNRRIETHG